MDLNQIREERQKWFGWKNIIPYKEAIDSLSTYEIDEIILDDTIEIKFKDLSKEDANHIEKVARTIQPWRKGPFKVGDLLIDSEWQSQIKYNLLKPHFNIEGKLVGDIGCNNGYYLFRMLKENPKALIGFDPSAICYSQFAFINYFVKSKIRYELLGVEHIEFYEHRFDTLFCLGVLYHRSDPISTLKSLFRGLNKNGELILDTFIIDGEEEVCLIPKDRYSKMRNIYFIPTINALKNWCYRAGFDSVELLEVMTTTSTEQRKTEWIGSQSLTEFLDPNDHSKTIEGYPAPKRAYIKAFKSSK